MKIRIGKERIYNTAFDGKSDIVKWDILNIQPLQLLKLVFISKNSSYRQGVRIAIDVGSGHIKVHDIKGKNFVLWEDTNPKENILECYSKEGLISIYNLYEDQEKIFSQGYTSGMIVKEEGNITTYNCNDTGFDTRFDKLVFSIEKVDAI